MARRVRVPEALREAQRIAEREGWIVRITGGNHIQWRPSDKKQPIVHTSFSPRGGKHSIENSLGQLRASGLRI
jgi:hypothetical protein